MNKEREADLVERIVQAQKEVLIAIRVARQMASKFGQHGIIDLEVVDLIEQSAKSMARALAQLSMPECQVKDPSDFIKELMNMKTKPSPYGSPSPWSSENKST